MGQDEAVDPQGTQVVSQREYTMPSGHERSSTELPQPVAHRLQRPSWRDSRLVAGVVLILAATLGGAATLRHFDASIPVLQARHALVPGQTIRPQDVAVVKVRLPHEGSRYVTGSGTLPGGVMLRVVRPGELIPRSAVGRSGALKSKSVAVPVDPAQSADLVAGSVVDVWVSRRIKGSTDVNGYEPPQRVLEHAVVARVPDPDKGALSVTTGDLSVHVLVPQDSVAEVLTAVNQGAKINLVPAPGTPLAGAA